MRAYESSHWITAHSLILSLQRAKHQQPDWEGCHAFKSNSTRAEDCWCSWHSKQLNYNRKHLSAPSPVQGLCSVLLTEHTCTQHVLTQTTKALTMSPSLSSGIQLQNHTCLGHSLIQVGSLPLPPSPTTLFCLPLLQIWAGHRTDSCTTALAIAKM